MPSVRTGFWVLMLVSAAVGLVVLGSRLVVIHRAGSDVAYYDGWDTPRLYRAWQRDGWLSPRLYSGHNEHPIVLPKFLQLALLTANGMWDSRVEAVVNALLMATAAIVLAVWFLVSTSGVVRSPMKWTGVVWIAAAFSLPVGWLNIVWGWQSCVYLMISLSVVSLVLAHWEETGRWAAIASGGCMLLAVFTMASGFFAAIACLAVFLLQAVRCRDWRKILYGKWGMLLASAVAVLLGFAFMGRLHRPGGGLGQAALAFAANLSWPNSEKSWLCVLNWLPFVVLVGTYVRGSVVPDLSYVRGTLALSIWALMQTGATAMARGCADFRHTDVISMGSLANGLCVVVLLSGRLASLRARRVAEVLGVVFFLVSAIGWTRLGADAVNIHMRNRERQNRQYAANIRGFLVTSNACFLDGRPFEDLPVMHAGQIRDVLEGDWMRPFLPLTLRDPLAMRPCDAQAEALRGADGPSASAHVDEWTLGVTWGTHDAVPDGGGVRARFEPARAAGLPWLQFRVLGSIPDDGVRLWLQDEGTGGRCSLMPKLLMTDYWQNVYVRAPEGNFSVICEDASPEGWVAFAEPRELGTLSMVALGLCTFGSRMAQAGVWLGVALILAAVVRVGRSAGVREEKQG